MLHRHQYVDIAHLNIIVVWRQTLRALRCDVNIRTHQRTKETLQSLLNAPQLIL